MSGAGASMESGTSIKPGTSMKEARAALEASRRQVLATVAHAETILTQAAGARSPPPHGIRLVISRRPMVEPGATWPGSPPTMPRARFPPS